MFHVLDSVLGPHRTLSTWKETPPGKGLDASCTLDLALGFRIELGPAVCKLWFGFVSPITCLTEGTVLTKENNKSHLEKFHFSPSEKKRIMMLCTLPTPHDKYDCVLLICINKNFFEKEKFHFLIRNITQIYSHKNNSCGGKAKQSIILVPPSLGSMKCSLSATRFTSAIYYISRLTCAT